VLSTIYALLTSLRFWGGLTLLLPTTIFAWQTAQQLFQKPAVQKVPVYVAGQQFDLSPVLNMMMFMMIFMLPMMMMRMIGGRD